MRAESSPEPIRTPRRSPSAYVVGLSSTPRPERRARTARPRKLATRSAVGAAHDQGAGDAVGLLNHCRTTSSVSVSTIRSTSSTMMQASGRRVEESAHLLRVDAPPRAGPRRPQRAPRRRSGCGDDGDDRTAAGDQPSGHRGQRGRSTAARRAGDDDRVEPGQSDRLRRVATDSHECPVRRLLAGASRDLGVAGPGGQRLDPEGTPGRGRPWRAPELLGDRGSARPSGRRSTGPAPAGPPAPRPGQRPEGHARAAGDVGQRRPGCRTAPGRPDRPGAARSDRLTREASRDISSDRSPVMTTRRPTAVPSRMSCWTDLGRAARGRPAPRRQRGSPSRRAAAPDTAADHSPRRRRVVRPRSRNPLRTRRIGALPPLEQAIEQLDAAGRLVAGDHDPGMWQTADCLQGPRGAFDHVQVHRLRWQRGGQ